MTSFYAPNHLKHIAGLEAKFGPVSDEVAVGFRSLVRVICQHEDPALAAPFLERCCAIVEALHGPRATLPDLDTWIEKASNVDFEHVEPFQLRRLAIKSEVFGEASLDAAEECRLLGQRYSRNGRYAKAREFFELSIAIREKRHGAESVEVAEAVDLLAETSARLKKWDDAETCLERSVDLKKALFGARSEELARTLLTQAIVHAGASKLQSSGTKYRHIQKAVPAFELGLGILEELAGPNSLDVQKALEAMIRAYVDCREFSRAVPLLKRLLAICEQAYGDDAAALLWILADLAECHANEGPVDEAEATLERGFEVMRIFLDAKKPIARHSIMDLAGNKEVLYGGNGTGVLEKLVRASETLRNNLKRRWGG